ncbi:MAG: hypothetical protein IJS93_01880 [Clostridia bacterium]|nr:hypothetical protein [Clostridia bacterium]
MRKYLFGKGAAMIFVMIVMVLVLMMSTLLLSIATIGAKRSKREFDLTEERMIVEMIGHNFVANNGHVDMDVRSDAFLYEEQDGSGLNHTLTIKRKDETKLLEVTIDPSGNLIAWRQYYR